MAELDISAGFGAELKDGFKPVNAWVGNGIAWLDEMQQFYRERSAIEKEYAGKLSALAKKYFEKKARKSSSVSVGDTPTVTPGSLESASMTTWGVQLTTLESRASEHDRFATQLVSNLADPLKHLASRSEELRKYHIDYATKLEKERDSSYNDLKKMKGKYDGVCQEVENRRKKTESSFDSSKQKAQNTYNQQLAEMRNVKNSYIISINVTNKQKERYYHEYVPELLDSMQDLSETRVSKMNSIWSLAAKIEMDTLARSTEYLNHLSSEIPRNNPLLDSMMFARHNGGSWQEPSDMVFEPSPVWLDQDGIAVDDASKVFLRNLLTKSKTSLGEFKRQLDQRRRELENAQRVKQNIRDGKDKRDEVEVVRSIFTLQESTHEVERHKITAEVEVSTITSAVGDLSLGARNHDFRSQTFKIPTNCDLCGDRIWGLSAKGFDCKDCGYTCHSKCEMKVPADCPGEQNKEEKKKLKTARQDSAHQATAVPANGAASESHPDLPRISRSDTANSLNTLSSGYSATAQRSIPGTTVTPADDTPQEKSVPKGAASSLPATRRHRVVAPPPAQYIKSPDGGDDSDAVRPGQAKARMIYPYQQAGDGEISVDEGTSVIVTEADDGSGWAKVRTGSEEGLVPAAYMELLPTASTHLERPPSTYSNSSSAAGSTAPAKKKGPAVAPKRGAKKLKYVEALYDYDARSDAEYTMREGERFVLVSKDAGDGWADVERGGQVKSVPANYIQEV